MRTHTILISLALLPAAAMAQCSFTWVSHPFGSCTEGDLQLSCNGEVDSVLWSDGHVGFDDQLPPGDYNWQAYHNGQVVQSFPFQMKQLGWGLSVSGSYWQGGGFSISAWAEVGEYTDSAFVSGAYCDDSSIQGPCCHPVDSLTHVRLVQDGVVELAPGDCMGCESLPCYGHTVWFGNVPTGHTYHLRLHDLACGQVVDDTTQIIANSCNNLSLLVETSGTQPGTMQGQVNLLEAVPDTTESYPLHSPVSGIANLYRGLDGWNTAGPPISGVSANWAGLDTGYYRVVFTPDAGCNQVTDTVYVSFSTGVNEATMPALVVAPTDDPGQIRVQVRGGVATQVRLFNAMGQELPVRKVAKGLYDIGAVPSGAYLVQVKAGGTVLTTKFLRE